MITSKSFCFNLIFFRAIFLAFLTIFSTSVLADQGEGKKLYLDNCAICHGNDGKGGMGIPLALQDFLKSASNDYIKQSIRLGRPERIMPSFYWMSEKQINSIITYISHWRDAPAPVWDSTLIKGNAAKGKALFITHCVSCHGENGRGGKGTGMRFSRVKDLPVTAPALNNQGFLNSAPDKMLQYIIKQGRKGTPMPAAKTLGLNDENITDLVSYIRSFQQLELTKKPLYHDEPASLIVDSPYSFDETLENVKRAIVGANFIHIRDQALSSGLNVKSSDDARHTIVYFCNFSFLYDALNIDPRVGMFLPCRITVSELKGKVQIMSINPKHLSQLFNNNELDESCDHMYELYTGILEDASL